MRIRVYDNGDGSGRHKAGNNTWGGSQIKIWLKLEGTDDYTSGEDVMGIVFHELTHYTHFHEVNDWPYPASQWEWRRIDCGVKEAWAQCAEQYLSQIYYPAFDEGYGTWQTFNQMNDNNGIFIDMIDNVNQFTNRGGNRPDDDITGVRLVDIERAIHGNNNNLFSEVMDDIKRQYPDLNADLDDLFEQYSTNVVYECGFYFNREWE